MRKFTMFVLLATSAIPAMAAAQDEGGRHWRQQDQQQQSDKSDESNQRPQREERQQRNEQRDAQRQQIQAQRQAQVQQMQGQHQVQIEQMQAARQQQVQQMQQSQGDRQARIQQMQAARQQQLQQAQQQGEQSRGERMQQYRQQMEQRRGQVEQQGALDEHQGRYRPGTGTNPALVGQPAPENREARVAAQRQQWQHHDDRNQWSNRWRNDDRYDWRRYRDRHHSIFQIGFYYDPFGYSYNRFGIGSYMYPGYYQSNYWINDPWQYRLPAAYGPYRWVRYHNDALMIDTWTGEVVDVIYGFFW